ncbi:hypothetical protein B484DRAFT_409500 [Ochromonadaceae sp. CCMP2298]|nr:hypothetical protein B484DRAFT_409500 [Ochromonadaceae sp. CCMP2298]
MSGEIRKGVAAMSLQDGAKRQREEPVEEPVNKRRKADHAALILQQAELSERHPREILELQWKQELDRARLLQKHEIACALVANSLDAIQHKVYGTCDCGVVLDEQEDMGCINAAGGTANAAQSANATKCFNPKLYKGCICNEKKPSFKKSL